MGTITVGVDLAKQVFSVCVVDGGGRVGERRDLKREAFAAWLVQFPRKRWWRWKRAAAPTTGRVAASGMAWRPG